MGSTLNWPTIAVACLGAAVSVLFGVVVVVYQFGGDHKEIQFNTERLTRLEENGSPAVRALEVEVVGLRRDIERLERRRDSVDTPLPR